MKRIPGRPGYRVLLMTSCSSLALLRAKPDNKDDAYVMFWLHHVLGRATQLGTRRISRAA